MRRFFVGAGFTSICFIPREVFTVVGGLASWSDELESESDESDEEDELEIFFFMVLGVAAFAVKT